MDKKQHNSSAEPQYHYPPFKYSPKIVFIPLMAAVAVFFAINVVLMPMLGIKPIQNNDEQGALTALVVSLAVSAAGAIVGFIFMRKHVKATERKAYEMECARLRQAATQKQEQARLKAEADAKAAAEQEAWHQTYEVCEFCGNEFEFEDKKGQTHERSYGDGYQLEVKTSTTGVIRENRVNYYIQTGTQRHTCPHCRYTVSLKYEKFNGMIQSFVDMTIYTDPAKKHPTREEIENGRFCKAHKITRGHILY